MPRHPPGHQYEAFGERKRLNAWARDPRCEVSPQGLYHRVIVMGLTVEQALTRGPFDPTGQTHTHKVGLKPKRVTAWGESKTLDEWAADPRARVPRGLIDSRLRTGYSPEWSITAPRYSHHKRGSGGPVGGGRGG